MTPRPDTTAPAPSTRPLDDETRAYLALRGERRRLVVPLALVVTTSYLALIVLANFTSALDASSAGPLSWAYVLAFAQFVVALVVTSVYRRRIDRIEATLLAGLGVDVEEKDGARA